MSYRPLSRVGEIEDAAIAYVMDLERQAGREPVDRRHTPGFAGDIWSPPRTIEVKAVGTDQRGWFVPLQPQQYEAGRSNPDFYLYVVDNVAQANPSAFRLKVFGGELLRRLVEKAVKREYYEMAIPVKDFDNAPEGEAALAGTAT